MSILPKETMSAKQKQVESATEDAEDIGKLFKRIDEEKKNLANEKNKEEYDPFSAVHLSPFKPKE
ncbi:hypothetical protein [Legionella oakridgensis]|uniref:Uncharacterized protein n=2 Tax=Legionella oakridgensis TaxID=29423 RepID=W0BEX6_9GAMM|nr:hypothetical protein [Legionella oakridgensis]AHE68415.1 hypothetical protein Loa_02887 [Legionella oakridgensis ATCC 33761 = DSM 21215]ETO92084.1 hypothetical protein LOR_35c02850 [Legionella oakridgensis RV-2-2007]KTD38429.1 hypothetical protein Loak_1374 [Legionella oakridgensis]STY21354.1 Uncharacterised protein [Legionella longbeachae]